MARADVRGMKESALRRYDRLAAETAREMQKELRDEAPYKTGKLRNSIRVTKRRASKTRFVITARTPVVQAATTNTGARPHVIRPRGAKVLSFYWPKVGARVAFRFVNHPGNRGTHWWDRTIQRHSQIVGRVLRRF